MIVFGIFSPHILPLDMVVPFEVMYRMATKSYLLNKVKLYSSKNQIIQNF